MKISENSCFFLLKFNNMTHTNTFPNLGMVIARGHNLWRIPAYGLNRTELVVFDLEEKEKVVSFIHENNIRFSIHTPLFLQPGYHENPLLACIVDPDPERRCLAVGLILENIELAAELGAEFVVAHIQRPEQFAGAAPDEFDEKNAMAAALASAEVIAEKSRASGVPVFLENLMDNSVFHRPEQYIEILEAFPDLGFCLDVGHLDVDTRRFGIDFWEAFRALAPHTREMHLHNSAGLTHPTAPRPWKIPVHPSQKSNPDWCDIEAIIKEMLAVRPECIINLEFRPEKTQDSDFIMEGVNWIRDIMAAAGKEKD